MKNVVIIVAGGFGSRMASTIPKQYLLLAGRPVLMHTMERFAESAVQPEIVIVIDPAMQGYWDELCLAHDFTLPHHICYGGATRFQSVNNGLNYLTEAAIAADCIAVHDAARPLITPSCIAQAYNLATEKKAVIVATRSTNSIRQGAADKGSKALDRNEIWMVQTPQVFQADLLYAAYRQPEESYFTDDASVVEQLGNSIYILEGDYKNIKITFPEDLTIAQLYYDSFVKLLHE